MQGVDIHALMSVRREHPEGPDGNKTWLKFCDWKFYAAKAAEWVERFRLYRRSPKQRILDVGCGFGYFLRGCRHFGHDVMGVDIEDPIYRKVWRIMQVPVVGHALALNKRLPMHLQNYDLITMMGFGLPRVYQKDGSIQSASRWSEWANPVEDVLLRLKPGGKFFCVLNVGRDWLFDVLRWQLLAEQVGGEFHRQSDIIFTIRMGSCLPIRLT